ISAMGKTTNAMEMVVYDYLQLPDYRESLQSVKDYHQEIMGELFEDPEASVSSIVKRFFKDLENFLKHNRSQKYDFVYDQIVCYGELISTSIVSEYLKQQGIDNEWKDARSLIKTDNSYLDAQVEWEETQELIA